MGQLPPDSLRHGTTVLRYSGVSFAYPGSRELLLDEVNLEIAAGEIRAVVADNGLGKSTLARLALGQIAPRRGEVLLFGRRASGRDHASQLAFIGDPSAHAEMVAALPAEVPVGRLLAAHRELFAASGLEVPDADELEQALGLADPAVRRRPIGALNKGHFQRLQTVLALGKRPRLLIADEVSEGLDRGSRHLILTQIAQATRLHGTAVLWISHRFEELAALGAEVFELRDRRLFPVGGDGFHGALTVNGECQEYDGLPGGELVNLLGRAACAAETSRIELTARRGNHA